MIQQDSIYGPNDRLTGNGYMFTLRCGVAALERPLINMLETVGLRYSVTKSTLLLLDLPCGFVWQQRRLLEHHREPVVLVTLNPCPEYREDLWDLKPAGLVAKPCFDQVLPTVVHRVIAGERVRLPANGETVLTANERALLRGVAHGWDNLHIANHLKVEEKTVRNALTGVYRKLKLTNRVQAALYYWGRAPSCG